jgi:predicted NAD/FAD-binding protein
VTGEAQPVAPDPRAGERLRVAVVGGGVAGITAAHVLQRRHEVTLFERNDYVGGHTHTVVVPDGPDAGTPVDTGFIVLNDRTYPTFRRLLADLGVGVRDAEMSFSLHDERRGFFYAGNDLNGLFAQRRNLLRPSFLRMLRDILRFSREGLQALESGSAAGRPLRDYLAQREYGQELVRDYLVPMSAAVWSTSPAEVLDFPAESLLRFFRNHGLLSFRDRPQWQTVVGGSHAYVRAFLERFTGQVHLASPISALRRTSGGVAVRTADGSEMSFDRAVIAAHADEALALLADPSEEERRLLGAWRYQENHTVLHTDPAVLPPRRRARASWNFVREAGSSDDAPVSVSYWMNLLQGLEARRDYCVSLNRRLAVREESVIARLVYHHPAYTGDSLATQYSLPALNCRRATYFCGSYFGYGFHEDAVRAGAAVGRAFGLEL